ncbi:hypothetical protein MLD38_021355 [Melastoma candidum]|uniref:Uncharacterized protein n=1 Tax=Melastoma candidum TaxID=119954 RepID=A0ACB9QH23_9MYRT|nr:hypothetical protein MLD38_021355 [Melastoma candidum]
MSLHPRRIPPPGASKKRKEREPFYNPAPTPNNRITTSPKPSPNSFFKLPDLPLAIAEANGQKSHHDPPTSDNRILAGFMAHEFLTRGTILGHRFDPGRADGVAGEPRGKPGEAERNQGKGKGKEEEHPSYGDVAGMLRKDGVHIPGVFNPSHLLTWLRQ